VTARRRVDWSVILGSDSPAPAMVPGSPGPELAALLSASDELLAIDDTDAILRRAVQLARERIGLDRVGIFLLDEARGLMLGTWGMDLHGAIRDEHHVMYELGDNDREVFRRAAADGVHWTVLDNCPIVEQLESETRVVGRGWVACTPIRSARGPVGMLFNDTGLRGVPVDETKQARAALLCSLLGTILDLAREEPGHASRAPRLSAKHPMVVKAVQLLANNPSLAGKSLAKQLGISFGRLVRVFKAEMGMSLVEYRNRLRLERFSVLIDSGRYTLLQAALESGFGSYAQFHRVFRALRGVTPREYLRQRG